MARIRLSTTVDASFLEAARSLHSGTTDAAMVDDAVSVAVLVERVERLADEQLPNTAARE
jgi:hypothetical protein